jgi:hypothetical protein
VEKGRGKGKAYVSRPTEDMGMRGPEGVVFRSLMREEKLLAVMFSWAYLRLRSSMSGGILALIMVVDGGKVPVATNLHSGR